jgi:hypothetical protein
MQYRDVALRTMETNMPSRQKLATHGTWMGTLFRRCGIAGLCGALLLVTLLASDSQAYMGRDRGPRNADCAAHPSQAAYCEGKAKKSGAPAQRGPTGAQQQNALLQSALSRLAPQRAGVTDFYTIGVAGWADQDVFLKELNGALASLTKILPIGGRVVRLVNRRDTMRTTPLATRDNLAEAVRAVAEKMDRDEDVLILFMTSHGNRGGFALQLPGAPPVELPPREVAQMLASAGIKNRLVIVSACYSGTFVPPLANDDTIIMTAADANNPSFGCAPGRNWTYFGDALFNRNLRPGVGLSRAFNNARTTISEWELMQSLSPSNPQAHFGPALLGKLDPYFAAKPGAAR